MTAHPTPENAGVWWLVSGKERRLHGVPGPQISLEQMRTAIDDGEAVRARAACGMRRRWWYPGLFSRMARTRCTPCCQALGITAGCGTPVNETSIKERQRDA